MGRGEVPVDKANKGLMSTNNVNYNDRNREITGDGSAQDIGGWETHVSGPETWRYYDCNKEGHLKHDLLKLKAKRVAEEANNMESGGAGKADGVKGGSIKQDHTMLVDIIRNIKYQG